MHLRPLLLAALAACGPATSEPLGEASSALCLQDQPCTTSDGCQRGHVDCASGTVVCTGLTDQPEGTACANGRICQAGACTGCGDGLDCYGSSGCRKGAIDCTSGAPVCSALADEPDGKACVNGACEAGACRPLPPPDAGTDAPDAAGDPALPAPGMVRSGCTRGVTAAPLLFGVVLLAALPSRRRDRRPLDR
ncbi:MAG TPA: hypothetical protein VGK67_05240 [Myxococcales bacterium]|jgi:hypothetical protein